MLDKRLIKLYQLLTTDDYETAESLASKLSLSNKTIRNMIKELDSVLSKNGAHIKSKHGFGYTLVIDEQREFYKYIESFKNRDFDKNYLPSNSKERIQYLLEYLLDSRNYVKIDDLSQLLYISKKTLTKDLKEVEKILNEYNIVLKRKPGYGIKTEGKEFDSRLCMASFIVREESLGLKEELTPDQKKNMNLIAECLTECLRKEDFSVSSIAFQNLIVHIYIAIMRIKDNHYIPLDEEYINQYNNEKEYKIAKEISQRIKEIFNVNMPKPEIGYISIHLTAKKMNDNKSNMSEGNLVINQEVSDIVTNMLQNVYDAFKFDFRDDLELRMSLSQHIAPLSVRIKYDMNLKNPLLKDIKERYTLAYSMASSACTVIDQYYNKKLKDDEIGYIALSFALALERRGNKIRKKNILIVCASGKGSAQLLLYKYKSEFGNYINNIETCDASSIYKVDLKNIDYIFTTVPIKLKVSIPIQEVQYFLEDRDIKVMKRVLSCDSISSVLKYYDKNLFFSNLTCKNKSETLKYMCNRIIEYKKLPKEFYESVLKRESLAKTEFDNMVAMPHPYVAMGEETFVCVAILDKPILWWKKEVQVIFLLSIGTNKKEDIQKFYQVTSKLLMNSKYVKEIIKGRDYGILSRLLRDVETEVDYEEQ